MYSSKNILKRRMYKKGKYKNWYKACIIRASELQFLGFVNLTKRKTDHVERFTWGVCRYNLEYS